jgi:hypothetical protein
VSTGIRNTHRMASSAFTGTLTASTLSTTTTSHDLRSPLSYSSTTPRSSRITDDDDDQIVWNVSGGSNLAQLEASEKDFLVLAKPRSDLLTSVKADPLEQKTPVSATKRLEMPMTSLISKAAAKKAKKFKRSKKATASSVQDTTTKTSQQRNNKRSGESPKHADILQVLLVPISQTNAQFIPAQVVSAFENLGLGQRPIVDDLSEQISVISGSKTPTVYEEASTFISMCVPSPSDIIQ